MKDALAIIGALIILPAEVPYVINIVRGKTKPNIVSWITWTLLVGIGAAALFAAHQPHAGLLVLADAIGVSLVVPFGLKYGIAKLDKFDIFCQVAALVGVALWLIFNSPMIAIVATVTIDLIATVPTLRHSWNQPEEETAITFAMSVIAAALTVASLKNYQVSAWLYPVYLLISNALLTVKEPKWTSKKSSVSICQM
jgi:hypothetical protein